jgi:aspartate/methionine/tyrosine aminotransferase
MFLSKLSRYASSPIREEDYEAFRLSKEGKEIIKLSAGDPARYFKTPKRIVDAYIEALKSNKNYYSDSQGVFELREAIAKRHKKLFGLEVSPEKILITQGISEGIQFLNMATIDKGDKGIIIRPYYPSYIPYLKIFGGSPIFIDASEENGWDIDISSFSKKIKNEKRIKYMIITNPNNPAGYVLSRKKLDEIVDFANEHDIFLISDEIYDEIVFEGKFTSLSEVAKGMPHMVLNGMSKSFVGTGFRLGYMLLPNDDPKSSSLLSRLIEIAQMRLSPNTPAQFAYAEGLNDLNAHMREAKRLSNEIKERVYFATKEINKSEYMHAQRPQGSFYILPKLNMEKLKIKNDKEFVSKLLEEKFVQITRGSGFGIPDHIRLVSLAPREVLKEAISRIDEFCNEHKA